MDKEHIDPHSDLEDFKPLKRKKLSKCYPVKMFKTAATSEQEINDITKGYIPNKTKRSTSSIITPLEEDKLWDCGIFGISDPKSLQRRVCFFYIGKRFCLLGGEEQRCLGSSQFIRSFREHVGISKLKKHKNMQDLTTLAKRLN